MERLAAVFGRRLRAVRKQRGLTQEQLGKLAKIDYKHLGAIERGEHAPSFDAVDRLMHVLKLDLMDFFAPQEKITSQLEEHIDAAVREIDELDKAELKKFFVSLLSAVRRLRRH